MQNINFRQNYPDIQGYNLYQRNHLTFTITLVFTFGIVSEVLLLVVEVMDALMETYQYFLIKAENERLQHIKFSYACEFCYQLANLGGGG